MRELKFRAWNRINEKMYEVESVDFFWNLLEIYTWEENKDGTLTKVNAKETEEIACNIDETIGGCILMQYTGINDIEGNEIFEGDIVERTSVAPGGKDITGEVVFLEGSFWIKDKERAVLLFTEIDELRVIGNIYRDR